MESPSWSRLASVLLVVLLACGDETDPGAVDASAVQDGGEVEATGSRDTMADASFALDAALMCTEKWLPPVCNPLGCSELNETCEVDTDCCYGGTGVPALCVGGYCTFLLLGGEDVSTYPRSPACLADGGVADAATPPGYTAVNTKPVRTSAGCADTVLCRDGVRDESYPQLCLEEVAPPAGFKRADHVERVCLIDAMDRVYYAYLPITLRVAGKGWRWWSEACDPTSTLTVAEGARCREASFFFTGSDCTAGH